MARPQKESVNDGMGRVAFYMPLSRKARLIEHIEKQGHTLTWYLCHLIEQDQARLKSKKTIIRRNGQVDAELLVDEDAF